MKLLKTFKAELIKQKRGLIWIIVFLIPLATTGAMYLDIYLRDYSDFLARAQRHGLNIWHLIILENHFSIGWGRFISIFVSVICSVIFYTEYKNNSWKNMMALPLRKSCIYFTKFITILFFTWLLISLNTLGLIFAGKMIGITEPIKIYLFIKYAAYQSAAVLGIVALHHWLSSYYSNTLIPIFIGVGGVLISAVFFNFSPGVGAYFPYNYHFYIPATEGPSPLIALFGGMILGVVIFILGYLEFVKRDIV